MSRDFQALVELAHFHLDDEELSSDLHYALDQIAKAIGQTPENPLLGIDQLSPELFALLELKLHESITLQPESEGNDWLEANLVSFDGEEDQFQIWFKIDPDH